MANEYMRPDFHINPDDYPEDVAAEAEIRADEREQCCKDICDFCASGIAVRRSRHGDLIWWEHIETGNPACRALDIRERAWKESESR
jgi:hypothetical protein